MVEDKPNDRWGFKPDPIEIKVGDTIQFVNDGQEEHDFTAVGRRFESPLLPPGGTFSHTFTQAGDVRYVCTVHENMEGLIRVSPG